MHNRLVQLLVGRAISVRTLSSNSFLVDTTESHQKLLRTSLGGISINAADTFCLWLLWLTHGLPSLSKIKRRFLVIIR